MSVPNVGRNNGDVTLPSSDDNAGDFAQAAVPATPVTRPGGPKPEGLSASLHQIPSDSSLLGSVPSSIAPASVSNPTSAVDHADTTGANLTNS